MIVTDGHMQRRQDNSGGGGMHSAVRQYHLHQRSQVSCATLLRRIPHEPARIVAGDHAIVFAVGGGGGGHLRLLKKFHAGCVRGGGDAKKNQNKFVARRAGGGGVATSEDDQTCRPYVRVRVGGVGGGGCQPRTLYVYDRRSVSTSNLLVCVVVLSAYTGRVLLPSPVLAVAESRRTMVLVCHRKLVKTATGATPPTPAESHTALLIT